MSVRLNKALRELNIGVQTAVEFLEKKPDLGEIKADLNFKLSDEQFEALVAHFKRDAEVRTQAEKLFPKKQKERKEKKQNVEVRGEALLEQPEIPQLKTVGKIDLDGDKKKQEEEVKPEPKIEAAPEKPKAEKPKAKKEEPKVKKEEPKPEQIVEQEKPEKKVTEPEEAPQKEEPKAESKKRSKSKASTSASETAEPADPEKENKEVEIFRLRSDKKLANAPQIAVVGKIDLDAINQSTRPKKKTKEERRREREEKAGNRMIIRWLLYGNEN